MVARFCAAMVEGVQSSSIAAGVYINNRVRIASLLRGIPEDQYDEVRSLFLRIRDKNEVLRVLGNWLTGSTSNYRTKRADAWDNPSRLQAFQQ